MATMRTISRPELQYSTNAGSHPRPDDSPSRSPQARRSPNANASPRRHHQSESLSEARHPSPGASNPVARMHAGHETRDRNGSTGSNNPANKRRHGRESRHKLSSALRMANNAVLLDNNEEYQAAIDAYEDACKLLSEAIAQSETEDDRRRLMDIRGSYAGRVDELKQLYNDAVLANARESQYDIRPSLDAALDSDELRPVIETATVTRILDTDTASGSQHSGSTTRQKPVQMPLPLALKKSADDDLNGAGPNAARDSNAVQPQWPPRSDFKHGHQSDFKPGHQRSPTSETEVEFDAALDAAVEAAYMEGYEPIRMDEFEKHAKRISHRFSLARNSQAFSATEEKVNAEREAKLHAARAHVLEHRIEPPKPVAALPVLQPYTEEEEEEERILDHFNSLHNRQQSTTDTTGSVQTGRQSDSSAFSGQTWGSSAASSLTTAPALSTVEENPHLRHGRQKSLPPLRQRSASINVDNVSAHAWEESNPLSLQSIPLSPTVRERRLSRDKAAKALKIATPRGADEYQFLNPSSMESSQPINFHESQAPTRTAPTAPAPSGFLAPENSRKGFNIASPFPSPLPTQGFNQVVTEPPSNELQQPSTAASASEDNARPPSESPQRSLLRSTAPPPLKQSASSLSLRNYSHSQSLVPSPSEHLDPSPSTPISFAFNTLSTPARGGPMAPMNTPANFSFQPNILQQQAPLTDAQQIFDSDLHSPDQPGLPNVEARDAPTQLEPCPESTLLRPYWLMRCFYQTLAHSRGGYISQKLFIPRDVWKAKNVKLKSVEEKISACDLLTAALQKLGTVDTYDADAVLEEMQAFENVLDQAQSSLSKKLGGEVGVQNISLLFKDAPSVTSPGGASSIDSASQAGDHTSGSGSRSSSKGYFSSFRKLRGKTSTANLAGTAVQPRDSGSGSTMSTVPMTSTTAVSSRGYGRHQAYPDAKFIGPNGSYMGALARLCDAVQVLDQIARQVEDPGLRHSSPTHVGLELSSRHAAEFFGFYVCRFILQDVIMLSEKYIKKASEWVMT